MAYLYSCLHLLPTITSHGKFEAEGVNWSSRVSHKERSSTHTGVVTKKIVTLRNAH